MSLQGISFTEEDNVKNVCVVYRIRTDNLMADEISTFLGIQPTEAYSEGEIYMGKEFDPTSRRVTIKEKSRPFGIWNLDTRDLEPTSKRVHKHIEHVLSVLEPRFDKIKVYLDKPEKFTISFYIQWSPLGEFGTYIISSNLMNRMHRLSHFTEFSFISPE